MSNHTTGAPAPTHQDIHNELVAISLLIGAYTEMPEDGQRKIVEIIALLGESPKTMTAAELIDLIAPTPDAEVAKEVEQ